MITLFDIHKQGRKGLCVLGCELQDGQYLNNYIPSLRNYTWEDSITINILKLSTINKVIDYRIVPHYENLEDSCSFEFDYDGMHEVVRVIIPTFEWYDKVLKDGQDLLNLLDTVVYFKDGQIVSNDKVIDVVFLEKLKSNKSTIVRSSKFVFNDSYLKECYIDKNKQILKDLRKCQVDKQEAFKRDILFMAINCILYALDVNLLWEALSILEDLSLSCSDLCCNYKPKQEDCGCNR